ncbi:MAG: hypothetical protein D3908_01595 [Candidatus Electrothrix sp. AUS4]|nr:hypothetical protein [Candidatus Electrothrix sp. AUS4]
MADESKKLEGIAIGGTVSDKRYWPPKQGEQNGRHVVFIAYMGGTSSITVSPSQFEKAVVGTHMVLQVNQNSKGPIYNDAVQRSF